MKKYLGLVAVLVALSAEILCAQDAQQPAELVTKRGEKILPVSNEWALGVSADPFLNYLGNMFNENSSNRAPRFNFPNNGIAVHGKYMKDNQTAYRTRFNFAKYSNIDKGVTVQDQVDFDPNYPSFTQDWRTADVTRLVLAVGLEKRRGSSRVQGIYGAELIGGFSLNKTSYEYGNPMSIDFPQPNTSSIGNVLSSYGNGQSLDEFYRVVEASGGNTYNVGARGFVGVEYFLAPKISLGAEFGYTLGVRGQSKGLVTAETWDFATNSVRTVNIDTQGGFQYAGFELDNLSSFVNLLFYF